MPVVVLKENAAVNSVLTRGQLEYRNYPKDIVNSEFVIDIDQAAGNYAVRNIKVGTPLFNSDISNNKAIVVPHGMVRVTFSTNLPDSLAGAILPGAYINLGFVSKDGLVAKALFENTQIARITDKSGNEISNSSDKKLSTYASKDIIPATVTVILKPEDSLLLKQHELQGRIFIMGY